MVTAVAMQVIDGSIRILADYVREGEPAIVIDDIIAAAPARGRNARAAGRRPPPTSTTYNNVGLAQAVRKIPMEIRPGVVPERARKLIKSLLQRERQGMPMLLVSSDATWTLNAFAGGYAHLMLKGGVLADYAEEGVYRILMEGVESYIALLELGNSTDEGDSGRLNAATRDGRRYTSMLGARGR
jgi:hypothetical protein